MKAHMLLLPLPIAAALAFVPQDPVGQGQAIDPATVETSVNMMLSELQYIDQQGKTNVVSARNVVEIRMFDDNPHHVRLELLYDNGDYSLIDAQAMHLLRNGASTREVKLVRSKNLGMRFPRLP